MSESAELAVEALKKMGYQTDTPIEPKVETPASDGEGAAAADTKQAEEVIAATPATEEPKAEAAVVEDDITDEKILAALKKRGLSVNSLGELKTPERELTAEEKDAEQKRVRDEAIAYGLQNKKISKEDMDAFAVDQSKTALGIARDIFSQKIKALEPDITEEEINGRFAEWAMEGEDDNNWHKKMRMADIEQMREGYIKGRYANLLGLTDEYQGVLSETKKKADYNQRISDAINSMPEKLEFEVPVNTEDGKKETKKYSYTIPKETRDQVLAQFQQEESYRMLGKENIDTTNLQLAVLNFAKEKELNRIIATIANSHAAEQLVNARLGRRGIRPDRGEGMDMEDASLATLHPAVAATVEGLRKK